MSDYVTTVHRELVDELHAAGSECPADLVELYSLLVLTRGVETTLEDVHDAWAVWRVRTRPEHASLVPFAALTAEVQAYDEPYRVAIVAVACRLHAAVDGETPFREQTAGEAGLTEGTRNDGDAARWTP